MFDGKIQHELIGVFQPETDGESGVYFLSEDYRVFQTLEDLVVRHRLSLLLRVCVCVLCVYFVCVCVCVCVCVNLSVCACAVLMTDVRLAGHRKPTAPSTRSHCCAGW